MKKIILFFAAISFLCFLSKISYAQAPDWLWAKSAGSTDTYTDNALSVAVDTSGNAYVAGWFDSFTITFGSTTLTNAGNGDIFLAKYDAGGNVLWAKSAGGTNVDKATSVAVDASGNIYVAGSFYSSTLSFDSTTLTNVGIGDIFLAKYDANGNVLWAKSAGGSTNADKATSVAVDTSGNTYVAGFFISSTLTFDSTTLTNTSYSTCTSDIFLAKYDANGNVLWAKSAGGTDNDEATSVVVDASRNTYVAGFFQSSTITFDSFTLTNANAGSYDIFLAKYNANGNVLWAKCAGGTNKDWGSSVAVDSVDASENIYLAGWFLSPTITFGSTTLTNADTTSIYGTADIFLAKYDAGGNVLWAKSAGGAHYDEASSVVVDASGNVYVAGEFFGLTITFGSNTFTNADTNGYADIFLAKYNANGNVLWAKSAGGISYDWANSVAVDASGNTYIAGNFNSSTLTFGFTTLTNVGSYDIFLAKLDSDIVTGINELSSPLNISVFPNPTTNNIKIIIPCLAGRQAQKTTIEILNIKGQIIKSISADETHTTIDISGFASGMYFVKVKTDKGIAIQKFVKK